MKGDNFDKYRVDNPNAKERVRQSFYHFQTYLAAGQTQLRFFSGVNGQGGLTTADTNMEVAGQLPAGFKFRLESIEIYLFPGINPVRFVAVPAVINFANDMYTVMKSGSLVFNVGPKPYLTEAPLGRFPPKTCLKHRPAAAESAATTVAALTINNQTVMDYAAWEGRPYYMKPFITIMPQQNFAVVLNWPAVVPLPSGQPARIGIVFDGILQRYSQ